MLDKAMLKNGIKNIFENLSQKTAEDAAGEMADVIDAYVKTGTVAAGITVTGSSPAGPVTGATTSVGVIQ